MIKLTRPPCPYQKALENSDYKHPHNKEALKKANADKCMYCESKISHIDFAHIEHYRPKAEHKFPELEFVWENLGYVCPKCNNNKSDKFINNLPYIDPYSEDPAEYFIAAGPLLLIRNGNERSEITIIDIGLDRPDLFEKRREKITEIQKAITACYRTKNENLQEIALAELKRESESDKEYSFFVEALFRAQDI